MRVVGEGTLEWISEYEPFSHSAGDGCHELRTCFCQSKMHPIGDTAKCFYSVNLVRTVSHLITCGNNQRNLILTRSAL